MTKLNQIVAIERTTKNKTQDVLTNAYQTLQKPALLQGIARTYNPKDEDGDKFPSEATNVQVRADELITEASKQLINYMDITATKDWANTQAKADVVINDIVLIKDAPVPYLLWLEKQLVDLHTFFSKLPTLDPAETWSYDSAQDCYATNVMQTHKSKKVLRNHVKAEATDKHPAQVDTYSEDVVVGYWTTRKFSGALPVARVNELVERVEALQKAVKFARESANTADAPPVHVGQKVFGYLLMGNQVTA